MELVYVYIGNLDKNMKIKNIGINLSEKYKITYDSEKSKLNIEESNSYIENFWGERISSLHTIVGDNGAGKTTILKLIKDFFYYDKSFNDNDCFFIFLNERNANLIFITCGNFNGKQFQINNNYHTITSPSYPYKFLGTTKDLNDYVIRSQIQQNISLYTKIIYMNTTLDISDYNLDADLHIFNLSMGHLIERTFMDSIPKIDYEYDKIRYFFSEEIFKQFDFIVNYQESNFELPFDKPDFLTISIVPYLYKNINDYVNTIKNTKVLEKNRLDKFITLMGSLEYYKTSITKFISFFNNKSSIEKSNSNDITTLLVKSIVISYIKEIFYRSSTDVIDEYFSCCLKGVNNLKKIKKYTIPKIIDRYICLLDDINNEMNSINVANTLVNTPNIIIDATPYKEFLVWLRANLNEILTKKYINFSKYTFKISTNKYNTEFLREFITHYKNTSKASSYLDFSWGLSSGEYNYLCQYSRLYSKCNELHGVPLKGGGWSGIRCDNLIILIDEPDITFHPRWQQEYIKSLVGFLPTIYKDCTIKIIVTTHSPILLSDIPKQNTIFMKNGKLYPGEKRKETFGQNIYTLFDDAFFLGDDNNDKKNHMLIGNFANEKITYINYRLDECKNDIKYNNYNSALTKVKYLEKLINIIGEPIIKKVLQDKLDKINEEINKNSNDKPISPKLTKLMSTYDELPPDEKKLLINHIIDRSK